MPILHPENNVAVFRPHEFRKLVHGIPKNVNRERLEVLLFTGCRYSELKECHGKHERLDGKSLKVKNTKALAKERFRFVRLNNPGVRAVDYYFRHIKPLPHYVTFDENLKRWCNYSKIDPAGVSIKSFRKTWESWLSVSFPERIEQIFLSQGHGRFVALKHYLAFPFTEDDKQDMLYYVDGW